MDLPFPSSPPPLRGQAPKFKSTFEGGLYEALAEKVEEVELARRDPPLNGIKNIDIRSLCTHRNFEDVLGKRPFVFCDIDGGELDLIDPISVPGLRRADLLVEIHSTANLSVPQVTEMIAKRFGDTHSIRIIEVKSEYAEQARLIDDLRSDGVPSKVLDQVAAIRREDPNNWLVLTLQQGKNLPD